jgi:hypothetical protein
MGLDGFYPTGIRERDASSERVADAYGLWAGINSEIAHGAETAALAAGLHHQAAAVIGAIEDEVAAISALLSRAR